MKAVRCLTGNKLWSQTLLNYSCGGLTFAADLNREA